MSDFEDRINHEVYRYAVGKQLFCPVTNAVLDVRTAVVVESANGEHIITVVSPEGWAERGPALLSKFPTLHIIELGKATT